MKRFVKIAGGLAVLLIAVVVAGAVVISSQDFNKYKSLITDEVLAATGRNLSIQGNLDLSLSFTPSLVVEGVSFANADWALDPQMLTAKRLEAEVALLPLISGQVQVNRIVVRDLNLILERHKDGRVNWTFASKNEKPTEVASDSGESANLPEVRRVDIRNLRVTYKDAMKGEVTELDLEKLGLQADAVDQPLKLDLAGTLNGLFIEAGGSLGSLAAVANNTSLPVDLTVGTGGVTLGVKGTIAKPQAAEGLDLAVTLKGENLDGLKSVLGNSLPLVKPFDIRGQLKDKPGGYDLAGIVVSVGSSHLTADASVLLNGPRPKIRFDGVAKRIDLEDIFGYQGATSSDQKAKDGGAEKLFSRDPLPLDALKIVDANLAFLVQEFKAQGISLTDLRTKLTLDNGALRIDPLSMTIGEGSLAGVIALDGRTATPKINIQLDGDKILLGQVMEELGVTGIIGSPMKATVRLSGRGQSVASLMAGLNGKVTVVGGEGEINNKTIDWAGGDFMSEIFSALNPIAKRQDYSVIHCSVVNFDINNGQANADKGIAIEGDKLFVQGTAKINLDTEALAAKVTPRAREGLGLSLADMGAGLVQITGTLAAPTVGVDPLGALGAAAKVGAAIATGGLSILGNALINTDDDHPCSTALGIKPPESNQAAPASPEPAKANGDSAGEQLKKGLDGALKGLFGK